MRVPNGRFRVVAGDGRAGVSGDGGPAVRAELVAISDLAFAPDRRLYVANGGHVRVVERNGVIHTVAGSGRGRPLHTIASGTPALSAPLGPARPLVGRATPLSLDVSPSGQLYISTGSIGRDGTTYVDELPGSQTWETQQQLVAVSGRRVTLLWQRGSAAAQ